MIYVFTVKYLYPYNTIEKIGIFEIDDDRLIRSIILSKFSNIAPFIVEINSTFDDCIFTDDFNILEYDIEYDISYIEYHITCISYYITYI